MTNVLKTRGLMENNVR